MEPQTPIQGAPSSPPASNSPDPSVTALTKTIGTLESGGDYNAGDSMGDGAASSGAYQMTPAFLENWAPKAGVNYTLGETLTPQQQDQIATETVKTLGTQGLNGTPLTPQQIISYWNTGNPNAYQDQNYGKNNAYGSTANEVSRGVQLYNSYMQGSDPTASDPQTSSQVSSPSNSSQPNWAEIALGAGAELLGGLWGYAQKPLTDAAVDAGTGAVVGSVIPGEGTAAGAITGAVAGIGEGLVQDFMGGGENNNNSQSADTTSGDNSQSSGTSDLASEMNPQASGESQMASQLINDEINRTQPGRNFSSTPGGQQGIATAGTFGNLPNQVKQPDGSITYDSTNAINQSKANESQAAEIEGMAAGDSQIPIADVINQATQALQNDDRMTPGTKKEAEEYAGQYAREYANANGVIQGNDAIRARQQQYREVKNGWGKMSSAQIEARKAVGKAFRESALKYSKNPELQEAAIKQQQAHINEQKALKHLHNKKVGKKTPGLWKAAILKTAATYAEAYIGEKIGGPVGAILGYVAGSHINNAMMRSLKKTNWDTKEMKSAMDVLRRTKPKAYDHIIAALKKSGTQFTPEKEKGNETTAVEKDVGNFKGGLKGMINVSKSNKKTTKQ